MGVVAISTPKTQPARGRVTHGRAVGISAVSWAPPSAIDYEAWVLEGRRFGAMGRGSPWWIGDWLLYGTAKWGERYAEAAKITGYDTKSLRNMRYVASRFELSLRRDNLTWSHHALVAAFDSDEQQNWLERATVDRLSVSDLRVELRSARKVGNIKQDAVPASSDSEAEVFVCPHCGYEIPAVTKAR